MTANISSKSRSNPYVFTEQGVYMLMTVLKEELAVRQSIALVRTFKRMKDYILENRDLIGQREILQLSMETANNRIEINKIAEVGTDGEHGGGLTCEITICGFTIMERYK